MLPAGYDSQQVAEGGPDELDFNMMCDPVDVPDAERINQIKKYAI